MKCFDIIIKIGAIGINEDEVLDQYFDILHYIQENLPMDNYLIEIKEDGEYL